MTKEEYSRHTSIASSGEANRLLNQTRVVFIVYIVLTIALRAAADSASDDSIVFIALARVILIAVFLMCNISITRKTKRVTEAWAGWSILFAPISWIWYYPNLVKPLKVIAGIDAPPESIMSDEVFASRLQRSKERFRKSLRIWGVIAVAVILLSVALTIAIVMFN